MKRLSFLIGLCAAAVAAQAQEAWSLRRCIDYAVENNISVKQIALQRDYQALALKTSQLSFTPNLNANLGQDFSFGRATGNDNITIDKSMGNTTLGITTSMPIFTGLRITNQIKADKLDLLAATEDLNKAKENLALQIAGYYLNVLYNKELLSIADDQVKISEAQVKNTEALVAAGKKSESELYENKAQMAADIQSRTEAANALQLAILDLCQAINYIDVANFAVADIDVQHVLTIELDRLASPDDAYRYSLDNRPAIRASEARVESSLKSLKVAQAGYYPQLNLNAGYNTGYYHLFQGENVGFGNQLSNNSSEYVSFSLSIPIFNRMTTTNQVKQARISVLNRQLELENEKQALLKEIQTAYYNAVAARDRYNAAGQSAEASRVAFEYEQAKYESGKSTPYDFNTAKLRWEKARAQETQAKYEFLFRNKIFAFYNGEQIDL